MISATHLAILGRQPELGLIELESILGSSSVAPFGQHALVAGELIFGNLGGSIKLGRIIARLPRTRLDHIDLETTLLPLLPRNGTKLIFAVSSYGLSLAPRELEAFGLSLKKKLKAFGSVRLVTAKPGTNELTAAQLKFNRLPQAGFELLIASDGRELVLALTEAVQDIDSYTARDYARPARSAKVGMLPPKLAQILINTTQVAPVYDPFCGTGVVLQEALLMGRSAAGSDLDDEMRQATQTNLEWLGEHFYGTLPDWSVTQADAQLLQLPDPAVAVVSEGYLGPNLTGAPHPDDLPGLVTPLLDLYRNTLRNLASQLPSGAELALCAPAWRIGKAWRALPIIDEAADLGYTVKVFKTVPRSPLVYGREGQAVGRALILLKKV